jgi:hypothetical protein
MSKFEPGSWVWIHEEVCVFVGIYLHRLIFLSFPQMQLCAQFIGREISSRKSFESFCER